VRDGRGFFQTWLRNLWLIVGLSLAVAFASYLGWFHGFQSLALDSLLLTQSPRRSEQVVIVTIDNDEFSSADLFNNTSPLDPEKLGQILEAIAAGHPRVIAVDIDTSSTAMKDQYRQLAKMVRGEGWPPVIWSVDGQPTSLEHDGPGGPALEQVFPPLGGNEAPERGLILLPTDRDGVVRRYFRHFATTKESSHDPVLVDSFPWAVVKEYCRQTPDAQISARLQQIKKGSSASPESPELLMNFLGDRFTFTHITTKTVLDSYAKREFWSSEKSPIRDKIVLLGGTYKAARDVHPTPIGQVAGVELLAMAIESELQGTGIQIIHEVTSILIDILFGSLLVYLNWRFVTPRSIFFNLLAVMALALVASFITFNTLGYWLNFAVVLIGLWLHNQYEVVREIPHLHDEIHELKNRLRAYEAPRIEQTKEALAPAIPALNIEQSHNSPPG
jgi:CHASE2 domain-containing sensor protein